MNVPDTHTIISLDAVAMFSNIDPTLVLKLLEVRWNVIKEHTDLNFNQFYDGVSLCVNNAYFQYDHEYYRQKFGTPMGSPISSFLAELVMQHIEEEILNDKSLDVIFYFRYVDDTIVCVREGHIRRLVDAFNEKGGSLKFTVEYSKNKEINFLDLKLIFKKGFIETLKNNNNNVINFDRKLIEPSRTIVIPYVPDILKSTINLCKKLNISIVFSTLMKLHNNLLPSPKDRIPKFEKTNVIYKLSCNDCNGIYIGQTIQELRKRVSAHKHSQLRKKTNTALCKHSTNLKHTFCFDQNSVKILDVEGSYRNRNFLEMYYIAKDSNSVNFRTDIDNLSIMYFDIIGTCDRISNTKGQ
ncbi:uncharacterized protein LOC122509970 [Leptopilina heterotoma]|uniref:uncharacterized protein LOC122509970 n=1 Tax=Leptopilina heterotoma TaxID=63436 RepID=UPI001CA7BFEB|nr:uncharacterized protein LOC122509970 [Leptopilina heterotoma]